MAARVERLLELGLEMSPLPGGIAAHGNALLEAADGTAFLLLQGEP
jgi:hypothetical protein